MSYLAEAVKCAILGIMIGYVLWALAEEAENAIQ